MTTDAGQPIEFSADDRCAAELDARDPLREYRALFHIPSGPEGRPSIYMCGNSLGLQPKAARVAIEQELDDWARLGVAAHLEGKHPWLPYHEELRATGARVVGAQPHEVVMMNSLTVNLHLLMVSFYRPTAERHRIVVEGSPFPSDLFAVSSQASFHGYDPREAVVPLRAREGEATLRTEDVEAFIEREGKSVAMVLLGAVNYLTGQWFDMKRITAAARKAGCIVGWDLAHAAGNVPARLHDWDVDFAAWCTYKYLNAGPGAVAGAFVHERHTRSGAAGRGYGPGGIPLFAGWWGNDPATRFQMRPEFVPVASADAWQVSNPPILSMAPVRASLEIFDRAGMDAVRAKSLRLTGYMEFLLRTLLPGAVEIVTPRDPEGRGAQLSLVVRGATKEVERRLHRRGVVVDFREPNIIRAAPAPLYNTFRDVLEFVRALQACVS